MKRREFIAGLAGGAAAWPLAAGAQSTIPMIGWLSGASNLASLNLAAALRQGLNQTGLVEGRDFIIEYRFADAQFSRLPGDVAILGPKGA
jgi:putative ABC transport system substrate-binding protein